MAIRFDKTSGKYLSRTTFGSSADAWTYAGWVYAVTKPNNGAYYGLIYKEMFSNQNAAEFTSVANNLRLVIWDGTNETGTTNLSITTWYHIALVRESNTVLKLYINGALDHTGGTVSLGAKDGISRIGCWDSTTDLADIRIAGWKIWGAGLTAAEVAQEMQTLAPRRYANLIGFLPMFPGTGERARDYSGVGNSYTENGTLTDEDPPPVMWGSRGGRRVFVTGGTTFNQSVDVTTTATFALIKSAGKIVAVTSTPAITRIAAVNKTVPAITTTVTPAILKQGNKTVDATATGNVTIARAITFVQTIAAAVTGTASLVKSVGKSVITTATGVVTGIRNIAKTIVVTSTGAVTQTKQATKATNIVATGTATIAKATNKSIAITVSAAMTLVKTVSKLVSTTINAAVDIATQFIAGGGTLFTQTISTTATTSVTVARQVQKTIAATVNTTISVARAVAKYISIPVAVTLTQARHITKTIATTVTTTANIYIGYFTSISVTVTNAVTISSEIVAEILGTMYRNTASIAMRIKDTASSALTTIQTKILNIKGSDDGDI